MHVQKGTPNLVTADRRRFVYPLWEKKQRKNWLEKSERARIWATFEEAAKLVREAGLKRLFNELPKETKGSIVEENSGSNSK